MYTQIYYETKVGVKDGLINRAPTYAFIPLLTNLPFVQTKVGA
jgi:hypothetical protein